MIESLVEQIESRFGELSRQMTDPEVIGDRNRYAEVGREYRRLEAAAKLVAKGLNNRDIAKQLFISENTVKNHIRNILEKLQLHSRMEAVVYAVREKLLEIT